jgi:hypothetical protein
MDGRLIDALVPVATDLDLVDPDDRIKGQKPISEKVRHARAFGRGGGDRGGLTAETSCSEGRGRGSSGHGQKRAAVEGHGCSHGRRNSRNEGSPAPGGSQERERNNEPGVYVIKHGIGAGY